MAFDLWYVVHRKRYSSRDRQGLLHFVDTINDLAFLASIPLDD